jgi:hypothetical protein
MDSFLSLVIVVAFFYFVPKAIFRQVSGILEKRYNRVDMDVPLLITGALTLGSWVIFMLILENVVEFVK